jgi:crossover junction endodeoxyribonuclease RuvC
MTLISIPVLMTPAENHQPTRILGVDPGLNITGYAVLEVQDHCPKVCEAGILRGLSGRPKPDMAIRIRHLYDSIVEVLDQFRPQSMVVEQLFAHYQHPRTAILMAHVRGVILLAAAQRGVATYSLSATTIKKTITGSGRAPKPQIQRVVQHELRLARIPEPPDVADALAVALCQYYRMRNAKIGPRKIV